MLVELALVEQRYKAVLEVLNDSATVTDVARRYGVARQTVHTWLRSRVPPRSRTRARGRPGTSLPSPDSQLPRGASVPPPVALAQREKGK